ncbi:NAD-dependent succinate-semialdehyde dehydrogenase [Bradymonas sediminis]|uniref:NADP-dependent succinic semialdehyde dehydrogenase n=1 Tax=Bradymonas sediminis TaxID=1548548 RepID=A0A2Z4FFX7_9DELT|nr:NAD-dependent succinate-semialdehyde dehydrogenase [Bradymonas sediminis]AWV87811.1 NADP-dependent succinic semialdehyde dehydrogenase [Bradymonas sediminis]TDP73904.1 succinate-semialdehyde dehydrogenase/glutarate-semialdehyde dehydrogenase [Bradymonas sediminis]
MSIRSINPATAEAFAEYPLDDAASLERKLTRAARGFENWRWTSFAERSRLMNRVAELLRERSEEYAELMTDEMGKPIAQARSEVEKCAWTCAYFAEHASRFLQTEEMQSDGSRALIRFDPLGTIFAVMPWNFPFWQVIRFAAPHLMAGNVGLLSHSANAGGCATALHRLFKDAGFPTGVFQSLFIENETAEQVIADPRVKGVSLTGSVKAGRAVAALAGAHLKPCVLELGGSDPFIVLADCDLDAAIEQAVVGRMINNGQSCIAAKRFIVEDSVYDDFVTGFHQALAAQKMGDPNDEDTDLGPMARDDLRQALHDQVQKSIAQGARCVLGGELPETDGFYYPATLLVDCDATMECFAEETFGPVAAVARVADTSAAIELANNTPYGLGASIWTESSTHGLKLAEQIEAGHVSINGIVKSDPRLPFGGIKDSGYGRELSRFGILEFVNKKTVWVK